MTLDYHFWTQARRSFFLLFGGIWLTVGSVFAVVGGGMVATRLGLLAPDRGAPQVAPSWQSGQTGEVRFNREAPARSIGVG